MNGLIRQYLPKGTDLSVNGQAYFNDIAYALNTRPRKALGFKTPLEKYTELLASSSECAHFARSGLDAHARQNRWAWYFRRCARNCVEIDRALMDAWKLLVVLHFKVGTAGSQ